MIASGATAAVAEALRRAVDLARHTRPGDEALPALIPQYYRHVPPEDIARRSAEDLLGAVSAHLDAARVRPQGTATVDISTPTVAEHGWTVGHSVVDIVTDDMPFLVDSVSAEFTGQNRGMHLLIHPVIGVRRDLLGNLLEVLPAPEAARSLHDGVIESWIHVEIDRIPAASDEPATLTGDLRRVLSDVREAVEDWPRMTAQALAAAATLVAQPPPSVAAGEAEEAAQLLTWLTDDNFTFLGYREYDLIGAGAESELVAVPGTGLGILRSDQRHSTSFAELTPEARAAARDPRVLILTKANSRSTVHRAVYLDYVGVKRFDDAGSVIGEHRFLGLYAASAYTAPVRTIPVIRRKVDDVFVEAGLTPESHSGKDIQQFLETFPRDEMFQIDAPELADIALAVHHLAERRQTRLFCRRDPYGRFMSCLVYLPRDRYTTAVRLRIQDVLITALGGDSVEHTARVSESILARLHLVVRMPSGVPVPDVDCDALERGVVEAVRNWADDFAEALADGMDESLAGSLLAKYADAFPEGYKEDVSARSAVGDVLEIESLGAPGDMTIGVYQPVGAEPDVRRLKMYVLGERVSLSAVLPVLTSLGVEVLDERPYEIECDGGPTVWIYDFGLRLDTAGLPDPASLSERFERAFRAAWLGDCEVDALNGLVARAGLDWRQVGVLRGYTTYFQQTGTSFSPDYVHGALLAHPRIAHRLVDLFEAAFDPAREAGRLERIDRIAEEIRLSLDDVASLDEDRILRSILDTMRATLRTNYYRRDPSGATRATLSIKLDPQRVPDLPLPRPRFEIWVHSPRVEGVHLRFGHVARGGLRWSDRPADFRTEVLGLVKAQEVKNAVIVPVGAKGGFVPKRLPDPSVDRDAWLAEGRAAYALFISALLDITDNLVDGDVVPPPDVVRLDGDDAYLVVAADKGTATFSDLANEVAARYDFWLGDAFASGGSAGYDHKAMGITARGAWESVERHFRDLGIDTQADDFTVVGIGDMSGDVFGNGMLLSEHIRLVAAFDHRHVFIDPDPDPSASFAERRRLFELPRSSWADYNPGLISPGGGVFSRAAKSIPVTPQMRTALGIDDMVDAMVPTELIRRILTAPVGLLWNGGIGTYVKAQTETSLSVGDKSNDAVRVNGMDLRCQVVGEGGNLGLTQLGRIEAARHGVRLNTDAIDNSAGVDTSDHEVNIKILLDRIVRDGDLTMKQRNALLEEMTDDVATLVLRDNYEQNVMLGNARAGTVGLITVHSRMIRDLEARGLLDRAIEYLPSDEELATRAAAGQGLTSPELAVLGAYAKIALTADLDAERLADDPWYARDLLDYFPHALRQRYAERIADHPLRRGITTTAIVNEIINHGGITIVFRAVEETGASVGDVVRAATATTEIFGLRDFWRRIDALDNVVPTSAQSALHLESRRLLDRGIRWFLQVRGGRIDVTAEIDRFAEAVRDLTPRVPDALVGIEQERLVETSRRFTDAGVPDDLALEASAMLDAFALLDIVEIAARAAESPEDVLGVYFALSERYDVDRLLGRITHLPRADRWTALARQALRSDLYSALAGFTLGVCRATPETDTPVNRIEGWESRHAEGLARARVTLDEIAALETADLATLSVALRVLRTLVAQARTGTTDH